MKPCFKCKETKPYTEFYKHSAMGDGYLNKCKACAKKDVHKHRSENIEKIREYDRLRFKNSVKRKFSHLISQINNRNKYPEKFRVRLRTRRAIMAGKITKLPCGVCGDKKSEVHHLDYSDSPKILFLCKIHHEEWHVIHGDFVR